MNSGELLSLWRSKIVDTAKPYLWSDEEAWLYMNAAYKQFVRLTVGIADFTSDATTIDVIAAEATAEIHPSILRVMDAYKSDGSELIVANITDKDFMITSDYGFIRRLMMDATPGPVRYMVIGAERGKVKWVQVPLTNDTVSLNVYRLPLVDVADENHPLDEVDELHHIALMDWMSHLAYLKDDAETFDKTKSAEAAATFRTYCSQVKDEWERYKHKNRTVAYGGI